MQMHTILGPIVNQKYIILWSENCRKPIFSPGIVWNQRTSVNVHLNEIKVNWWVYYNNNSDLTTCFISWAESVLIQKLDYHTRYVPWYYYYYYYYVWSQNGYRNRKRGSEEFHIQTALQNENMKHVRRKKNTPKHIWIVIVYIIHNIISIRNVTCVKVDTWKKTLSVWT